jgi:hypothetical protein
MNRFSEKSPETRASRLPHTLTAGRGSKVPQNAIAAGLQRHSGQSQQHKALFSTHPRQITQNSLTLP